MLTLWRMKGLSLKRSFLSSCMIKQGKGRYQTNPFTLRTLTSEFPSGSLSPGLPFGHFKTVCRKWNELIICPYCMLNNFLLQNLSITYNMLQKSKISCCFRKFSLQISPFFHFSAFVLFETANGSNLGFSFFGPGDPGPHLIVSEIRYYKKGFSRFSS